MLKIAGCLVEIPMDTCESFLRSVLDVMRAVRMKM
jgi:hypothetical protein